jgi:cytochrome P450
MWSVMHSAANFAEPFRFMPERWLQDGHHTDVMEASQPFLLGTRACMGRNMAWIELRIWLTKLVLGFEVELISGQGNWESRNKCLILWEKPNLWVRATSRVVRAEKGTPYNQSSKIHITLASLSASSALPH